MKKSVIDINCDVGEGIGNEADLFPYISSCNIACGGHAGDRNSMREVVRLAKQFKLKIGAHPSYPDRRNFGRVSMELSPEEFNNTIQKQVASLVGLLDNEGLKMNHIKPHGALYNDLAVNRDKARAFLNSIGHYREQCSIYVPYGSAFAHEAGQMGYHYLLEAFGDRSYLEGHVLAPRSLEGAVHLEPEKVLRQVLEIVYKGRVQTLNGSYIRMKADTFCVHGDTPSALQILMYLAEELPEYGIYLKG
jgi:UPF0271 protein